jgi:aminoglycoside phosphotransferase (APT) family kinase protein
MRLPDHIALTDETLAALAELHHISVDQITPLPDVGITNKMYRFGEHLMLRVPRSHHYLFDLLRKEARVVPAARAVGVHTPALVAFDDTCAVLPAPYSLYERVSGETLGLLDLEPEATPEAWRALGRDLALLHTEITPEALPLEELGRCRDLRADLKQLASAGHFTLMEARWFERLLDRLAPYSGLRKG